MHIPTVGFYGRALSYERGTLVVWSDPIRTSVPNLFDIMYLLIGFRKLNPPRNRQLDILISNSKQHVDDFWGKLTL